MVLNHAARVFDYLYHSQVVDKFADETVLDAPLGQEPPVQWLNGFGFPLSWLLGSSVRQTRVFEKIRCWREEK